MKELKLVSLKCEKFKGFAEKEFVFEGNNARVYGANGAGKSSLNDAFLWLLFGKNAAGETDFEIKPRGKDGALLFPGSETVVSAEITIDGDSVRLKRVLKEVWTTKRGAIEKVFSGNTTDFFIDDFPVKKAEYEKKIADVVAENVFRLISSTTNFFKMSPKDQRETLFHLTTAFTDYELSKGHPKFESLSEMLNGHTIEELRKKLSLERRNLSENRNTIPARLDELSKIKGSYIGIDFDSAKKEAERLNTEKEVLAIEKWKIESDYSAGDLEQKLKECTADMKILQRENQLHKASQTGVSKWFHEKIVQEERVKFLDQSDFRIGNEIGRKKNEIEFLESQVQSLREEYAAEDKKKPVFGKECPTCKRPYEEAALRATETKMLAEKKARMDEICKRAGELGNQIECHKKELVSLDAEKSKVQKDLLEAKESLAKIVLLDEEEKAKPIQDLPEYASKMEVLKETERKLQEMITAKSSGKEEAVAEVDLKIKAIDAEILSVQSTLMKEQSLEDTKNRIAELEEIAKKYATKIEEIDEKIFLCEEFTKYKVYAIEESINGKFEITTFSLFKEQINGGIADTCEAMKDGIPYSDLNNGSKVNVGIDVANSLSKHYGVSVPLFIDNAESVTEIMNTTGQSIKLYVSAEDKELRSVEE